MRPVDWNSAKILDSMNRYIKRHKRVPRLCDLGTKNNLPARGTITKTFGCTYLEFLKNNYPAYYPPQGVKDYSTLTREAILEQFVQQYNSLGSPSCREYDKKRAKNTPCTRYILRACGFRSYGELLVYCGLAEELGTDGRVHARKKASNFNVHVSSIDFTDSAKIDMLIDVLVKSHREE